MSLLKCTSCDEVRSVPGIPARRSSHRAPQRLKPPAKLTNLSQALEALRHPNPNFPSNFPILAMAGVSRTLRNSHQSPIQRSKIASQRNYDCFEPWKPQDRSGIGKLASEDVAPSS